jgi:hypothetical protein
LGFHEDLSAAEGARKLLLLGIVLTVEDSSLGNFLFLLEKANVRIELHKLNGFV